ncbi:right-handed parallel beta-helix repeat-containing protein [Archangium sp.]|jgi:hypothetical protein|uniref:right-handed parallel beta-helix repeat-containing protein n=1 Tax=Archangium sp. TaxID=1872627 RepID=UPI002EDAD09D
MSRAEVKHLSLLTLGLALWAAGCDEHGAPPVTYRPPLVIEETVQSPASVGPGDILRLAVTVSATRGESLSFSWSTTAGTVGTAVNEAGHSEVVWTSLSCLPPGVTPTVTMTVTDSVGRSTSHTFPVTWTGPTCTRAPCVFSLEDGRIALAADCTTDTTLLVPEDYTFDGENHTVTAVDPPGGHFTGAVIRNRGTTARVRDVIVTATGLKNVCEFDAARLRGILLEGASGEIVGSTVLDLQKGSGTSGCQEGFGIEVRNDDASRGPFRVDVLRNHVISAQKLGILAVGAVEVTISENTVDAEGPVTHIARNGIQVGFGARGRVLGNTVSGNAYTGPTENTLGAGILVIGGSYFGDNSPLVTDLAIEGNTLADNDVGIYLSQLEGSGADGPSTPTRLRVAGNTLRNAAASNPTYQAAIADYGTANVITSNVISGAGYDPATVPGRTFAVEVVAVGPASVLAFLTPAYDVATGACSGKVTVQSQDTAGNLVPTAGTFSLAATGPAASSLTFHADPACTGSALSTVDLSNPQAEATFYFKSSTVGTATVAVSGGTLSPASRSHTLH